MAFKIEFGDISQSAQVHMGTPAGASVEMGLDVAQIATNDHDALINRDKEDQHPIEAITGLQRKLADVEESADIQALSNEDIEEIINQFV